MGGKENQALYRRYRSTSFDELIGQEHVTELLKAAVKNGTFSHAYLLTGQRGTGKTSAARILAFAINGLPYEADAQHLDIIEIDAASNRRIDDIRDLREKVHIAPVSAKYKVYIIDEVHMLTGESFNALLKTLEEPPAHAVFILATTELHKVPATIVSRTQRFHFRPVAMKKVVAHLADIAKKEKINIDENALQLIAEHGDGSFRDSISLLDQLGSLDKPVTAEVVEEILGRARSRDIENIISLLENNDQAALHETLRKLITDGISPVTLSEQLVSQLLHHTRSREWYDLTEKLMSVSKAHFPELVLVSTLMGFVAEEDRKIERSKDREDDLAADDRNLAGSREQESKVRGTNYETQTSDPPPSNDFLTNQGVSEVSSLRVEDLRSRQSRPADSKEDTEGATLHEEARSEGVGSEKAENGEFDWEAVLEAVRKTNLSLHSVLARATVQFDDNQLRLAFQYALHRNKMDRPQYKTELLRTIKNVCGISPEIIIGDDKPSLASDDTAKKVADLMGGGEVVAV